MKIKLLLLITFVSIRVSGQNDTTIYYSKNGIPVQTINEATYYENLVKSPNDKYVLNSYKKDNEKWEKNSVRRIRRQSDSSYLLTSPSNESVRIYHRVDSGYMIHDVSKVNANDQYPQLYNWEGFSKTIFPLICSGIWRSYSTFTGDLGFEELYQNNHLISSKYWINDSTFIQDVYRTADDAPKFQGGNEALMSLIYNNIDYPVDAKVRNIHGKIIVGFVVLSNGQIVGVKPLNPGNKSLSQEAIRVVYLTQKKWIPAKFENKNVNSVMYLPVTFQLQ